MPSSEYTLPSPFRSSLLLWLDSVLSELESYKLVSVYSFYYVFEKGSYRSRS